MIIKIFDKIKILLQNYIFIKKTNILGKKILLKINSEIELWRFRTYKTKEPETIEWVNKFRKGEIFFDVGANVGLYSLFADKKGCKVFSFEPAAKNFSSLIDNIYLNKSNIMPYCIGLSNAENLKHINLVSTIAGDSQHNLDEKSKIYSRKYLYKQGIFSTSIDSLIERFNFPIPNHIKIDVDGHEKQIIQGAQKTLRSKKIKSLMIEINFKDKDEVQSITRILNNCKFKIQNKSKRIYSNKKIKAQNFYFVK